MNRRQVWLASAVVLMTSLSLRGGDAVSASSEHPAGLNAWCGSLGEYSAWYHTGSWRDPFDPVKMTLFVWKGKDRPDPRNLTVKFKRSDNTVVTVPNGQKGVQTWSGPQVDLKNGWVGYFISKTWVLNNAKLTWDDDWRWDVTGCLP